MNRMLIVAFAAALGLAAQDAPASQAVIALSVNGVTEAVVDPGWPVMIGASVTTSDGRVATGMLAPGIVGPDGQPATLIPAACPPRDPVVSGPYTTKIFCWTIAPDATAAAALGTYTVKAQGAAPATFEIRVPGTADSPARVAERLMVFSEYVEIVGDSAKAVDYADQLLKADPNSVAARVRKADALAAGGKLAEALRLLDEADMIVRKTKPVEPVVVIRERQQDILDRMLGAGDPPTARRAGDNDRSPSRRGESRSDRI